MGHKFRYVYGIPGQPDTYFFRYFTLEEIEDGQIFTPIIEFEGLIEYNFTQGCEIISRDQFTGHKDINGKELYQSDIVNHKRYGIQEIHWNYDGHYCACDINHPSGLCLSDAWASEIEIIGNIHGVK